MKDLRDKYLVYKYQKTNSPEVFGAIYDQYIDKIYRFIYFKVRTRQEAEDLTSEVFLKLWQKITNKAEVDNLNAYIYAIARNSVIDYYRQKSTDKEVALEELAELGGDAETIGKITQASDVSQLMKAINSLKDEYREVILLRYIEELAIKEIALILNKSQGATRVLLHRALKTLREVISS
ncbi:MAG TPA: RNA polymerase sigma factor [Patescibacteria group bacterium]